MRSLLAAATLLLVLPWGAAAQGSGGEAPASITAGLIIAIAISVQS